MIVEAGAHLWWHASFLPLLVQFPLALYGRALALMALQAGGLQKGDQAFGPQLLPIFDRDEKTLRGGVHME